MSERLDTVTKWIVIAPWIGWLVWELVLLILRWRGFPVRTISMQASRLGYAGLTSIVFFWFGLGAHYWIGWQRPVWSVPWFGVAFWAIGAAYLGTDLLTTWRHDLWPAWLTWARWPPLVAALGVVAGLFLFPQRGDWAP